MDLKERRRIGRGQRVVVDGDVKSEWSLQKRVRQLE